MSINRFLLSSSVKELFDVVLSEDMLDAFEAYYDLVIDSNREFNLTAIVEKDDFVEKHFIDSLASLPYIKETANVLDVGSGAGFPAFPIAVARKDINVVALDSTSKKMRFVSDAALCLGVKNLSVEVGRAEEKRLFFEKFDVVCARAVSSLPILLEICSPLVCVGGCFIAYKTDLLEAEQAKTASSILNLSLEKCTSFTLPSGDRRCLLVYKKNKATPEKYPRIYSAIKKNPL